MYFTTPVSFPTLPKQRDHVILARSSPTSIRVGGQRRQPQRPSAPQATASTAHDIGISLPENSTHSPARDAERTVVVETKNGMKWIVHQKIPASVKRRSTATESHSASLFSSRKLASVHWLSALIYYTYMLWQTEQLTYQAHLRRDWRVIKLRSPFGFHD